MKNDQIPVETSFGIVVEERNGSRQEGITKGVTRGVVRLRQFGRDESEELKIEGRGRAAEVGENRRSAGRSRCRAEISAEDR